MATTILIYDSLGQCSVIESDADKAAIKYAIKIADELRPPIQVGDRVRRTDRTDNGERIVTWIDPDTGRVHYRYKYAGGQWYSTSCEASEFFKIDDESEAR